MNDLGIDSLDHVEMIVALENEFGSWGFSSSIGSLRFSPFFPGFEIPDSDYEKLYTVQGVVDYLIKRMHVQEPPKRTVSSAFDPRYDDHHH